MIRFTVPGQPIAWQRPTTGRGHGKRVTPRESIDYQRTVADYAGLEIRRIRESLAYPCGGNFWLGAMFFLGSYKVQGRTHYFDQDLSNLLKNVEDGLQKIIFHNDKQIRGYLPGTMKKLGAEKPCAVIAVLHESELNQDQAVAWGTLPR